VVDVVGAVVQNHSAVGELIDNDWLTVFEWDAAHQSIARVYESEGIEQEIGP
jgi:hypothetical protein